MTVKHDLATTEDEAAGAWQRELSGPLTALLLYVGEIKHQLSLALVDQSYLKQLVENALQQIERICTATKHQADAGYRLFELPGRRPRRTPLSCSERAARARSIIFISRPKTKPLTNREREVCNLICEGYSNKQGALRMNIGVRTFESHRAEVKRKLGARNTADLIRKAVREQELLDASSVACGSDPSMR
jgi:DNA-binding CsgD family transcriptional regulator